MLKQYFVPITVGVVLTIISSYLAAHYQIYERVLNLDKLFHFTGGVIAAWLTILFFSHHLALLPVKKRILVIVSGGVLIGVVWEWLEYGVGEFSLRYFEAFYPYFHIGSLTDTIADLGADALGALFLAGVVTRRHLLD